MVSRATVSCNRRGGAVSTSDYEAEASARGDYGRASVTITTRPATSEAHDYTVRREAESPLDHGVANALRGINLRTRRNRAMRNKCQCQKMQMRMNDNQSRNLQS
eukprot:4837272-Pleurochrysis_carterae.AAC.1